MEGINSFDKGLHQSNSPLTQPEGSYFDAINWIRNDEGRLVSEKIEKNIWGLGDDLKGFVNLDDEVILLFQESISAWGKNNLGEDVNINIFDTFSRPFKLNIQDGVEVRARKAFNNDRIIYFVDSVNPPRYFNLDLYLKAPNNYNDLKDFNLFLEYKLPEVSDVQITTGGNLLSGVYSIVLRYRSSVDNKTFFGIPSKFYSITDDDVIDDNYDGCPPGTATNKLITFKTTHIDDNYPYIEPVIITYEGLTSALVAYSLGISANFENNTINFSGPSQYVERVDIKEISANPLFYETAQCIEAKDNILTLSNLTTKKYDRLFQVVANNIKIKRFTTNIRTPIDRDINFGVDSFKNANKNIYDNSSFEPEVIDKTNNIGYSTQSGNNNIDLRLQIRNKGFQPREVYSFSFTPIYKDGTLGFAYHIPCNNTSNDTSYTTIYPSNVPYPDYLKDTLTGGIRHHEILPISASLVQESYIIQLIAENIILDPAQKDAIQGYIIGYEKRDSDLKKRVIDEGVIRPYLQKNNSGIYLQSFLTGSCQLTVDDLGQFNISGNAYRYSSPATERGLKINTGYELLVNRYAISAVVSGTGVFQPGVGIIRKRPRDSGASLFFEEDSNTQYNTTSKINKVINVDTVTSEVVIDSNYRIFRSNKFVHLELANSVIDLTYYKTGGNANNAFDWTHWHNGRNDQDDHWLNTNLRDPVIACATIYNNATGLYGTLENAKYIPAAVVYNTSTTSVTLEGDTYKSKYWFEFKDVISKKSPINESIANDHYNFYLLAGIYITSQNNWLLRHSDVGEMPYYPKYKVLSRDTAPLGLGSIEIDKGLSTGYNKQYSAISDTRVSFHRPLIFEEVDEYPNRTIYSNKAFEGELVDQWRLFPANNFHDIPKNKGEITDTFIWNNDFYHHTERSIFKSFFNSSATQSNSKGQTILGNSGVFQLPSVELMSIDGGYMGTKTKAGINTPFGRIFLDNHQGKVFLFAGESPIEISDLGLFFFFRDFINPDDKYTLGYDYENKRVLLANHTRVSFKDNKASVISLKSDTYATTPYKIDFPLTNKRFTNENTGSINPVTKIRFTTPFITLTTVPLQLTSINGNFTIKVDMIPPASSGLPIVTKYSNTSNDSVKRATLSLTGNHIITITRTSSEGYYELNIAVDNLNTISFYPKTQTWTSFHNFTPKFYIPYDKELLAFKGGILYNINNPDPISSRKYPSISFIVNNNPNEYKRFDRMEFNTTAYASLSNNLAIDSQTQESTLTFTNIQCWNYNQNSGNLPLTLVTTFAQAYGYDDTEIYVRRFKGDYKIELPLDAVKDHSGNIFDPINLDVNKSFKEPLTSKFLYVKLSYNIPFPLILSYVKTFSKPTVA
jgi:hypothetical protein